MKFVMKDAKSATSAGFSRIRAVRGEFMTGKIKPTPSVKAAQERRVPSVTLADAIEAADNSYLNAIADERQDGPFVRVALDDL